MKTPVPPRWGLSFICNLSQRLRSCEAIKIHEYLFWRE
jgi:hypothetical protein